MLVHLWQPRATEATARGRERERASEYGSHIRSCVKIYFLYYMQDLDYQSCVEREKTNAFIDKK